MDSPQKHSPASVSPVDYNDGTYGGYPTGYGDTSSQRSLHDYLLILRERIWYIVVVFLVVFSSSLVFTLSQTKIYEATATVQIFRNDPLVMVNAPVIDSAIRGAEDLNTLVKILESGGIIQKVAARLTGDDLRAFMQPFEKEGAAAVTAADILARNRKVAPLRSTLIVAVQFRHPDRLIAAKVANLFVDEFMAHNARVRIDEGMKAVEDLQIRVEQQKQKVEELAIKLQDYREKNQQVSYEKTQDIVTEKLKALNSQLTQSGAVLSAAEIRWKQVEERKASGGDLAELPFIASQGLISQLNQQIAGLNITLAQLSERYRDKHPKMIETRNSLAQAQRELTRALDAAAASVEAEYQAAQRNEREARAALAQQEAQALELGRSSVDYDAVFRDFKINEQLLQVIVGRMRETGMQTTMEIQNARIMDQASPPPDGNYVQPNIPLNLAIGFVGGLGLGLCFALFVAFIDDRVKSSFDIESVVGLPLIGIIPQIKKMEQPDKAQIAINNADRQVSEAFLTLHSSLRLKDESKNAQCILLTSTIPGEGKSFTTTNLALTYSSHGERVLVIDCDLRKPNIHKSFRRENLKGVIDVCAGSASIDEVILKDVQPGLDVLPTGGRAKNPTQILNSKNFELMLSDLRKRYDRIFIDTPPLAAVSDALVILPLADGSIFTIFFNKVRRKAAQHCARKLLEANVPVFGAVLNGLNLAVSGYYYAQYYDKSYKDYYVVMAKEDVAETSR